MTTPRRIHLRELSVFKKRLVEVQRIQVLKAMPIFGSRDFGEKTTEEWVEWAVEKYMPDTPCPEGLSLEEVRTHFRSVPFLKKF